MFTARHVAVEGETTEASWPDVHLVDQVADQVADLSHAALPQIVEKAPHVRIWIVVTSLPSKFLTAFREIPRLVSLPQQFVPDAQVAFLAESASRIDVHLRHSISRALHVKPVEMCPSSRCPIRRPRLYWLSWKLPAVGHYSVERAKGVDTLIF